PSPHTDSTPTSPASQQPPPAFLMNDPPPTEIYTLSLHDALPISLAVVPFHRAGTSKAVPDKFRGRWSVHPLHENQPLVDYLRTRSEEHTSELQSLTNIVCRLLLEKKTTLPTPIQQAKLTPT